MFEMHFKGADGTYGRPIRFAQIVPKLPTRLERLAATVSARMRLDGRYSGVPAAIIRGYVDQAVLDLFPTMYDLMLRNTTYDRMVTNRVGLEALRLSRELSA